MDLRNAVWTKARRSSAEGANCVEVALNLGAVVVRDSKHPTGHVIGLSATQWRGFISKVRSGI